MFRQYTCQKTMNWCTIYEKCKYIFAGTKIMFREKERLGWSHIYKWTVSSSNIFCL